MYAAYWEQDVCNCFFFRREWVLVTLWHSCLPSTPSIWKQDLVGGWCVWNSSSSAGDAGGRIQRAVPEVQGMRRDSIEKGSVRNHRDGDCGPRKAERMSKDSHMYSGMLCHLK